LEVQNEDLPSLYRALAQDALRPGGPDNGFLTQEAPKQPPLVQAPILDPPVRQQAPMQQSAFSWPTSTGAPQALHGFGTPVASTALPTEAASAMFSHPGLPVAPCSGGGQPVSSETTVQGPCPYQGVVGPPVWPGAPGGYWMPYPWPMPMCQSPMPSTAGMVSPPSSWQSPMREVVVPSVAPVPEHSEVPDPGAPSVVTQPAAPAQASGTPSGINKEVCEQTAPQPAPSEARTATVEPVATRAEDPIVSTQAREERPKPPEIETVLPEKSSSPPSFFERRGDPKSPASSEPQAPVPHLSPAPSTEDAGSPGLDKKPALSPGKMQLPQASQDYMHRQIKLLLDPLAGQSFATADLRSSLRQANKEQPWFRSTVAQLESAMEQRRTQLPGPLQNMLSGVQLLAAALVLMKAHMAGAGAAEAGLLAANEAKTAADLFSMKGPDGGPMAWQEVARVLAALSETLSAQEHEVTCKICAESMLPLPRFRAEQVRRLGQAFVSLLQEASGPQSPVVGIGGRTGTAESEDTHAVQIRASRQGRPDDSDVDSEDDAPARPREQPQRSLALGGSSAARAGASTYKSRQLAGGVLGGGATSAYKLRQQAAGGENVSRSASCGSTLGSPTAGAKKPGAGAGSLLSQLIRKDPASMAVAGIDSDDEIADISGL